MSDKMPEPLPLLPTDCGRRFLEKIMRIDNGCWNWSGSKNNRGYGTFSFGGKSALAHRCSYEIFIGPIPKGKNILHKCNHEACVNPAHLYAGDQGDNYEDMRKAGTAPLGERNGKAKLTASIVRQIRLLRAMGLRRASIATALNITISSVDEIMRGKRWKHVQ